MLRRADVVTVLGAIICVLAGSIVSLGYSLVISSLLFFLGSVADLVDGKLARFESLTPRPKGVFIDAFSDKVGEDAVLIGICITTQDATLATAVAVAAILGLTTSYCKALATASGIHVKWQYVRFWGRTMRVLILGGGLLLSGICESDKGILLTVITLGIFNALSLIERTYRIARS